MNTHSSEGAYIRMLPFFLLGYAVAGRSFAYLGVPPLYMGEILLLIGIWQILQSSHLWKVFLQPSTWLLLFFMLWSMARTIPYIPEYGIMALRDGALWGYGLFAFVIAMILISHPSLLLLLVTRYQFFSRNFPFLALAGLVLLTFFKRAVFDISIFFQMKPGDILVHLAAITTFALCGFIGRISASWILAVMGSIIVAGAVGRGGLLAFSFALGFILLLRFHYAQTWRIILLWMGGFIVMGFLLLSIPQQNNHARKISPEQLAKNMASVFIPADKWGLEGTKRYRLEWWDKIIDYTLFGDYFLGGKGYGINLAEADNQLLRGDTSLRSPHNAHLTILARSGVPGLLLWLLLNATWFWGMMRSIIQAKSAGLALWEGWLSTLLAFYIAALINASFDVYLEGPMGGVWFWTVFGIGMASTHLFRTLPLLMVSNENPDRT